jgi:diguanylate cyclase
MQAARVLPTPRNYEIWFAFCSADKVDLTQRLEAKLKSGTPITPGALDDLYREFFSDPVDLTLAREASTDLQQIAGEMVARVSTDRMMLADLSQTLAAVPVDSDAVLCMEEPHYTTASIGAASREAGDRLGELEVMLAQAMTNIDRLRDRLVAAEREATVDALTGLANRRHFDACIARAGVLATEEKSDLSLLLLDIDHFKRFNDTYGHQVGDSVLRHFSRILLEQIKGKDTGARYGGEEFAVILPGGDLNGATSLAEQIRDRLGRRPLVARASGQSLGVVTCSIGVAAYRHDEPVGDLVYRADQALYQAKRDGRNLVRANPA